MDRKTKGLVGQAETLTHLVKEGYGVFLPFDGNAPFDLVAYRNGKFYRVFVRSTSQLKNKSSWNVELRNVSRRKDNAVAIKKFDKNSCDLVAVYIIPEDRIVLVNSESINSTNSIAVQRRVGREA